MIDAVGEHGYSGTRVRDLCARAGVSTTTLYAEFGDKDGYFLATFEAVAGRAGERVREAYLAEQDWTCQLYAGVRAFTREVAEQPAAARLALVEILGGGPTALVRLERESNVFANMIQASFEQAPDGITLPPLLARGVVGGISRVSRQLLVEHREKELPSLADTLSEWALTYRCESAWRLPDAPQAKPGKEQPPPLSWSAQTDQRTFILHITARITALRRYPNLTIDSIVRAAGPLGDAFFVLYPGTARDRTERCFLDAYDLMGSEVIEVAADAATQASDWIDSIRLGIVALLRHIADDPVFARCAFIEVFSVGTAGIEHRSRLMDRLAALLLSIVPADKRPPETIAEAIVGAVWQIAHHYVARRATSQLPELVDHATYLVLAPIIGGEAAMQRILDPKKHPPK
ncbi:MAG: TetR/AcrR family transcriptional regulator [Solirubrobacteraceae bacterium]